jgi:S1-C subfamily serine protease
MKKIIIPLLILLLISIPVTAKTSIFELIQAQYPILVNGQAISSDNPVLNYQGITYVPLRAVLDITGAKTEWKDNAVNVSTAKTTAEEVANAQIKNCVKIYCCNNDMFNIKATGSGIILPNHYILTNKHVTDIGNVWYVEYNHSEYPERITEKIDINSNLDISLLKVSDGINSNIVYGDSDTLKVGDEVVSISSPKGVKNTVLSGKITSLAHRTYGYPDFSTSCEIKPGSSGGAIFNINGELIGLIFAVNNNTENGYVIPINPIIQEIQKIQ